ncbi:MAG: hotdog fold thioesterase [Syntrophomonadaceae bacterium]|nr:hotdog fold thioesterase [Syntrophomonadaceae bacterium]
MGDTYEKYGFDYTRTVMHTLNIDISEFTKDRVVATMPVTPKVFQPYGIMHGGVSLVLAETVASCGSYLHLDPEKQYAVGLEINANHIRSVNSGTVTAIGVPIHSGRSSLVWDIKIYDEKERLICVSRCTMMVLNLP